MRREVESLLSFEDSGDIFIDQSPASLAGKALQKDKGRRYQTTHSLLTDLKEFKQKLEIQNRSEGFASPKYEALQTLILNPPKTEIAKPRSSISNLQSIAVLPFANLSADAEIDYFHLLKVNEKWLIVSKLWDSEL